MSASTRQTFENINDVKQAVRNGTKVYVCYEHKHSNHSGVLVWSNTMGYVRRFMGLELTFDFSYGRNIEPNLYFAQN